MARMRRRLCRARRACWPACPGPAESPSKQGKRGGGGRALLAVVFQRGRQIWSRGARLSNRPGEEVCRGAACACRAAALACRRRWPALWYLRHTFLPCFPPVLSSLQDDVVLFDANLVVKGDVMVAMWFTDHYAEVGGRAGLHAWRARTGLSSTLPAHYNKLVFVWPPPNPAAHLLPQWDPPALAYAFHTSFVDCSDGGVVRATGECVRLALTAAPRCAACPARHIDFRAAATAAQNTPSPRITRPAARKLDVPGSSAAAAQYAEREGFFMDLVLDSDGVPDGAAG